MAERFITIATFNDLTAAHIFKGRLEASGILCFLADENIVAAHPFYALAVGGIKLQVTEGDAEEAHAILNDIRQGDNEYVMEDSMETATSKQIESGKVHCPYCGSTLVEEETRTPSIFSFRFLFGSRKYNCQNCGNSWNE